MRVEGLNSPQKIDVLVGDHPAYEMTFIEKRNEIGIRQLAVAVLSVELAS